MNSVLELRARFEQKGNSGGGARSLPEHTEVSSEHLKDLRKNLLNLFNYWKNDSFLNGALVSVYYDRVIAKSNRLQFLLRSKGKTPNDSIVGAKFLTEENKTKHVITHFINLSVIESAVHFLDEVIDIGFITPAASFTTL